ncbi:hypothetical protein CMK18_19825 [Candidatus Poribacteria bacterium]|nr:hypothetical protein [Candidatus Poribacteria bacterium]
MKFYNPKRLVLFTAHTVLSVLISLLAVGQTTSVTPKPVKEPTQMITVQQGQTLADLAELYFGDRRSYKKFLDYNNIADINTLKPGDRLQVPIGKEESRSDRVGKETEQQVKSAFQEQKSVPAQPAPEEQIDLPELSPPIEVKAIDAPNDGLNKAGKGSIKVSWSQPDDTEGITGYEIWRQGDGDFKKLKKVSAKTQVFTDKTALGGQSYVYQIASVGADGISPARSESSKLVSAKGNWFDLDKRYVLITLIIFSIITLYYMDLGMSGKDMFIRRLPALDRIEEVVGRAAEMGRPAMFVAGNDTPDSGSTMAAFAVFESVANYSVVTQTEVVVPVQVPLVDVVLRSSLRNIFTLAGRPDLFNEDEVSYEVDNQPAYIGIIGDSMERHSPASIFYFGDFTYESMVYAEMGNNIGAVQVAGCENPKQTAFFIVGCDYCLIGEELFAAGAYLKRDVIQMATLLAQDRIKILAFLIMLLGIGIAIFQPDSSSNFVLDLLKF